MRIPIVVLAVFVAGCFAGSIKTSDVSSTTKGTGQAFKVSAVRQPAIVVRVEVRPGEFGKREIATWPEEYEGALVEALNARAIPATDVRLVSAKEQLDPKTAVARAREVGADHVFLVDARIRQSENVFCRGTRRAFRAKTAVWSQRLIVLRASDGARAFETLNPVDVESIEPDCDAPNDSHTRSPSEHVNAAVEALLGRALSP
jgi:hypothetical protein